MGLFDTTRREQMDDLTPVSSGEMPLFDLPEMNQGGYAINLIVAIRDHAPVRLDAIEKETADLQNRIQELQKEYGILTQLLQVVQNG